MGSGERSPFVLAAALLVLIEQAHGVPLSEQLKSKNGHYYLKSEATRPPRVPSKIGTKCRLALRMNVKDDQVRVFTDVKHEQLGYLLSRATGMVGWNVPWEGIENGDVSAKLKADEARSKVNTNLVQLAAVRGPKVLFGKAHGLCVKTKINESFAYTANRKAYKTCYQICGEDAPVGAGLSKKEKRLSFEGKGCFIKGEVDKDSLTENSAKVIFRLFTHGQSTGRLQIKGVPETKITRKEIGGNLLKLDDNQIVNFALEKRSESVIKLMVTNACKGSTLVKTFDPATNKTKVDTCENLCMGKFPEKSTKGKYKYGFNKNGNHNFQISFDAKGSEYYPALREMDGVRVGRCLVRYKDAEQGKAKYYFAIGMSEITTPAYYSLDKPLTLGMIENCRLDCQQEYACNLENSVSDIVDKESSFKRFTIKGRKKNTRVTDRGIEVPTKGLKHYPAIPDALNVQLGQCVIDYVTPVSDGVKTDLSFATYTLAHKNDRRYSILHPIQVPLQRAGMKVDLAAYLLSRCRDGAAQAQRPPRYIKNGKAMTCPEICEINNIRDKAFEEGMNPRFKHVDKTIGEVVRRTGNEDEVKGGKSKNGKSKTNAKKKVKTKPPMKRYGHTRITPLSVGPNCNVAGTLLDRSNKALESDEPFVKIVLNVVHKQGTHMAFVTGYNLSRPINRKQINSMKELADTSRPPEFRGFPNAKILGELGRKACQRSPYIKTVYKWPGPVKIAQGTCNQVCGLVEPGVQTGQNRQNANNGNESKVANKGNKYGVSNDDPKSSEGTFSFLGIPSIFSKLYGDGKNVSEKGSTGSKEDVSGQNNSSDLGDEEFPSFEEMGRKFGEDGKNNPCSNTEGVVLYKVTTPKGCSGAHYMVKATVYATNASSQIPSTCEEKELICKLKKGQNIGPSLPVKMNQKNIYKAFDCSPHRLTGDGRPHKITNENGDGK